MFRRNKTKSGKPLRRDDSLSLKHTSSGDTDPPGIGGSTATTSGKSRFMKILGPSKSTNPKSSRRVNESSIGKGSGVNRLDSREKAPPATYANKSVTENEHIGSAAIELNTQADILSDLKKDEPVSEFPESKLDPPTTIKKSNTSKSGRNVAYNSSSQRRTLAATETTSSSLPSRQQAGDNASFTSSAESETSASHTLASHNTKSSIPQNNISVGGRGVPSGGLMRDKISSSEGISNKNGITMKRSGWSITSSASSAMNSEHYIQSLHEMPSANAYKAGKNFPILNAQPNGRIRSALSRNFGREELSTIFHNKWTVKVDKPMWDEDEMRYKYKIDITRNQIRRENSNNTPIWSGNIASGVGSDDQQNRLKNQSFSSATTTRSLQDFVWLEQALRAEYHGALLAPLLSLAVYFGTSLECSKDIADGREDGSLGSQSFVSHGGNSLSWDNNCNATSKSLTLLGEKMDQNEVIDELVLQNWLSDILNGVRGHGEVILENRMNVAESEAMETFLFRHSEPLKGVSPQNMGKGYMNQCRISNLGSPFQLFNIMGGDDGGCSSSIFDNFLFSCSANGTDHSNHQSQEEARPIRNGLGAIMCSSGTTGMHGIQHCSSNLSEPESDFHMLQICSSNIATHSELLEAERDLIASYIKSSSFAIAKVHALMKDEAYIGQCWKRFALSLSNLFSVEKDLESAHIGDQIKSNKKKQPFRKLRKSAVDDGLKILARAKMDRASPSLETLKAMLNAYYADLNSVVPAFKEYTDALSQLEQLEEIRATKENDHENSHARSNTNKIDWQSQLKHLKSVTSNKLIDISKQITGVSSQTAPTTGTSESDPLGDGDLYSLNSAQTKALQSRVLENEKMLKFSITLLCKATPLRNARMGWWYLKTEAKQASNVHAAATALRQTLSIDADTAIAMKERRYDEDEMKDRATELDLVKRFIELGGHHDDIHSGECKSEMEATRRHAFRMATERVGRWDSETALAILSAAGMEDAEVQMDETSRELRHVRKYAISLREHVVRCLEAAEGLYDAFIADSESAVQISRSRREFWAAISTVFSGRVSSNEFGAGIASPSTKVLSSVGIDVNDRGGWLGHEDSMSSRRRRCGQSARRYLKKRDFQANILISRILKLLKDYERRLEGIESFVYMHCVGIQVEKHCSKARAKALSAWDKRTEISTAINVATKKKIPKLVSELKIKLDNLPQVSHTTVIRAKESHLTSKTLKSELHKLANRRFGRAQEVSTERVIAIMSLWAKHEESVAIEEVKALGAAIQEVEHSVQSADLNLAFDKFTKVQCDEDVRPDGSRISPVRGRSLLI